MNQEANKEEREKSRAAIIIALSTAGGRLRWSELLKKTGLSKRTLAKHLKQLEEEGLIERIVEPEGEYPPPVFYMLTKKLEAVDLFFASLRQFVPLSEKEEEEGKKKMGKVIKKWGETIYKNYILSSLKEATDKDDKQAIEEYLALQFYNPYAFAVFMASCGLACRLHENTPMGGIIVKDTDAYHGRLLHEAYLIFEVIPKFFSWNVGWTELYEAYKWWSNIAQKIPGYLYITRFVLLAFGFHQLLAKEDDIYRMFVRKYFLAFLREMKVDEIREYYSEMARFREYLDMEIEELEKEIERVDKELKKEKLSEEKAGAN